MNMDKPFINKEIDDAYQEYAKKHYNSGIKSDFKTFAGVVIGSLMLAVNLKIMLRAGNLLPGGFSGIAVLIQEIASKFFGREIPFTPLSLLLNAFPAYLCFKHIGKRFTGFSCFSVVLVSLLADFIPQRTLTNDLLLIAVFGGIIEGFGSALILRSGACSGGTNFLAMFFSVKKGINTFNVFFACNSVLILISGLLFGMDSALYTVIFQFVATQVVNFLYKQFAKKTLLIVTEKPHEIAKQIMSTTNHACTILNSAEGGYSGEQTHIVYAIVGANEIAAVRKIIKGTDPQCFINTLNSDVVTGRFFQRPIS